MNLRISLIVYFIVVHGLVICSPSSLKLPRPVDEHEMEERHFPEGGRLKLFTFNTWLMGKRVNEGLRKIARWIREVDADVTALQEVEHVDEMLALMDELGDDFNYAHVGDCALVTKHQAGMGARILVNGTIPVHVLSMHLHHKSYGPYAAHNKLVTRKEQLDAGRHHNVMDLLQNKKFQHWLNEADRVPLFVVGDFNSPSHLDWIEENKHLHGGWVYAWPVTQTLQTRTGLLDAFRELHPDPVREPGHTWSTVFSASSAEWNYTVPEPQDRIDFILYRSRAVRPSSARVFAGPFVTLEGNYQDNEWPSDHYSVISDFVGV